MLTSVTCWTQEPPQAKTGISASFYKYALEQATLYVPQESLTAYKSVAPWSQFKSIQTAGIEDIPADNALKIWNDNGVIRIEGASEACEVYDLYGRQVAKTSEAAVSGLATGVYLVKVGSKTFKIAL